MGIFGCNFRPVVLVMITLISFIMFVSIEINNCHKGIERLENSRKMALTINSSCQSETFIQMQTKDPLFTFNENPTHEMIYSLSDHQCEVYSLDFSRNGRTLVSGGGCGEIIFHDITNGVKIKAWNGHTWSIMKILFGPHSKTVASGSGPGTMIKIWNTTEFSLLKTYKTTAEDGGVEDLVFSPEGQILSSGDSDGHIIIWNLERNIILNSWTGPFNDLYSLEFSHDGQILAFGTYSGAIELWDVSNGSLLKTLEGHSNNIASLKFSPDSSILASGSYQNTKLWNVTDGSLLKTLDGHNDHVYSIVFHPSGQILATGSADQTIKLWNITEGSLLGTLTGHSGAIYCLAFHPDGYTLASGSGGYDYTIKIWNTITLTSEDESDVDLDGISDDWEELYDLNASDFWDKFRDNEGDNLMNILEFQFGTNPLDFDTDNDRIPDDYEYFNHLNGNLNDAEGDKDNDGMPNYYEYQYGFLAGANDALGDKDNDGLSNIYEYSNNLLPNDSDSDNDGLSDGDEITIFLTDPLNNDTDNDNMHDLWEVENNLNPLLDDSEEDPDEDGFTNLQEYLNGTNPHISDKTSTTLKTTPEITSGYNFLTVLFIPLIQYYRRRNRR